MKIASVLLLFCAVSILMSQKKPASADGRCDQLLSGSIPAATVEVKEPRNYRLITEYNMLDPNGSEASAHVVTGDLTVLPNEVRWSSVTIGQSGGHDQPVTSLQHRAFMEGFSYKREDTKRAMTPEFFRGFPAEAMDEKNLVWDELMFYSFATASLDKLRLNHPFVLPSGDVPLAGAGTFNNRRIELTWIGIGRRNGEDCAVIHYEALLNSLTINMNPMTMRARSDYLGDIWVSLRTHQLEYGTLLEEVAGLLTGIPNAPGPQPLHVLRLATLEHQQ
jgi:hypothetical protein